MMLARYYLFELFNKFKYVFAAVIVVSTVIIALQFSPAREFGTAYTNLSKEFFGPISHDKDKKMEELIDKHTQMVSKSYGDLENSWLKNFYNNNDNSMEDIDESELWIKSQEFLNQKGEYGNTVYDDMLILSTLINSYQEISQIEEKKIQVQKSIRRNVERAGSNTDYWTLLLKKSENLQQVEFYDMRAVTCFLDSYGTDWLFFFVIVIMLSTIFCSDYELNRHLLLFSMPISPVRIGIHKVFCSLFVALLCSVLSAVINLFMLVVHTSDFRSLLQPVQAIGGMSNSLFGGTILDYIVLLIIYKTITYFFISAIVTFISLICRKTVSSLIASISLVGISVGITEVMQTISPYNVLSRCNLLNLYTHNTFSAMDNYYVVFSKLVHYSTVLFMGIFLLTFFIFTIIIAFNRYISQMVVS